MVSNTRTEPHKAEPSVSTKVFKYFRNSIFLPSNCKTNLVYFHTDAQAQTD